MYNIKQAVCECLRNGYFKASTIFVKKTSDPQKVIFIGINNNNSCMRKFIQDRGDMHIEVYMVSQNYCMSMILSKDIIIPSLFSSAICLKDELDISRIIMQSIKPILLYNNKKRAPAISTIWNIAKNRFSSPGSELFLRFHNIADNSSFISNVILPLQGQLASRQVNYSVSLQFYSSGFCKDALYTVFFADHKEKQRVQLFLQKFLYTRVSELNCQNISVDRHFPIDTLRLVDKDLYIEISRLTFEFQSIMFSYGVDKLESENIITEVIYCYILIARVFFDDFNDFKAFNDSVYARCLWDTASDTVKFLINNKVYTDIGQKISKEHNALCLENASTLFANYSDILSRGDIMSSCRDDYKPYVAELQKIKAQVQKDSLFDAVTEIVNQLFHSFYIDSYFHSYIPYCIKFIGDEI